MVGRFGIEPKHSMSMSIRDTAIRLPAGLRVTLVHDWITQWGGPESVLASLANVFEGASLNAGVWAPDAKSAETFRQLDVQPSRLQRIPGALSQHRLLLPLMPSAFESLRLPDSDLVVSSSHGFAKAVRVPADVLHVCYCHTPPRYLWDLVRLYNPGVRGALRWPLIRWLRGRDLRAARRVDHFLANSRHVAGRIRRTYGMEARVIYPPVDVERFGEVEAEPEDYYLAGGRLVPYKRIDRAIAAANLAGFRLKVFGEGPDRDRLESMAGPTVEFLGHVSDDELPLVMARARAFLFPGEEDFGIVPVEAQAAGRPVIAWNRGGVRESVIDGQTGVLYDDPSANGLLEGLDRFEAGTWWPHVARRNAERFGRDRFEEEILEETFRVLKRAGKERLRSKAPRCTRRSPGDDRCSS
jgi:glycosyltransferase involved in cell wall biosynthesis